ncbi:MAG: alpha-galactosidase [bacterium]
MRLVYRKAVGMLLGVTALILSGAGGSPAQPITVTEKPKTWTLRTDSSVYQLAVASDGVVIPVYYGPAADWLAAHDAPLRVNNKVGSEIREVPFRGGFVNQTPALEVVFAERTRDTELVFVRDEIVEQDGYPALRLEMEDKAYGLHVTEWIRLIPELDLIQKWLELHNAGGQPVHVENAQSGSVWLQPDEYDLYHLSGRWGWECMLQKTRLTPGVKTLQTRTFRFYENPPWFAVGPAGAVSETEGNVWFGGVEWTGDFRLDFDKKIAGQLQIVGGINFWDAAWTLRPGETFTTPKILFGFSREGLGGVSHRLHDYARQHLLRPRFRQQVRPLLYNSWYATTFNITEAQQLALADVAKDLGVELFVIDDGWFKGRKDDLAGLGDWVVDPEKFPNGLRPMIEKIRRKGMEFGIWVEPEMVNPDSDLYRAHPDWAFHYPTRIRHESRNQLMLNLAREDVYQYLLDSLSTLLRENPISFIKWDYNRDLADPGWPDADPDTQREVRIRYFYNLNRLVRELENRFPDVWFECCSGGGGRISYGWLSQMDQFWTSDNTDPADRVMIQYGYLHGFPACAMVGWITNEDWHSARPSLKFRFHSSMCGVLGIGEDLTKWNADQRREAAGLVQLYKEIRPVVQFGDVHRLISPFETTRAALEYVTKDASEAVVFLFNLQETLPGSTPTSRMYQSVRLRGLDPQAEYEVTGDTRTLKATGETLMNAGIPWIPRGNYSSALLRVKKR